MENTYIQTVGKYIVGGGWGIQMILNRNQFLFLRGSIRREAL